MTVSFVQVVDGDGMSFSPAIAALSALARREGLRTSRIAADFGTTEAGFQASVAAADPRALVFVATTEHEEIVTFLAAKAGDAGPRPIIVLGPLAMEAPDRFRRRDLPLIVLPGTPEPALAGLLRAVRRGEFDLAAGNSVMPDPAMERLAPEDLPDFDTDLFGGPALHDLSTGASVFGETGVAPVLAGRGSPAGLHASSFVNHLAFAWGWEPVLRPPAAVATEIRRAAAQGARRIQFLDRSFGHDGRWVEDFVRAAGTGGLPFAAFTVPGHMDAERLDALRRAGLRRVDLVLDAADDSAALRLPGTIAPSAVTALARTARAAALDLGFLVAVGLPGETPSGVEAKIDLVRSLAPARARFFVFEPETLSPLRRQLEGDGLWPRPGGGWNREIVDPLDASVFPEDVFAPLWQRCLDVEAECQHASLARGDGG